MSENPSKQSTPRNPRRRRWLGVGLAAGLGTALAAGLLGHHAHGHWGGHGGRHHGYSQEHLLERLEAVFDRIDATEQQRTQVSAIVDALWRDLDSVVARHRDNRAAVVELLQAPVVDRAGLQALRDDEMDLVAGASNRVVEAVADVAEVLTPEQRQQLAQMVARHHH